MPSDPETVLTQVHDSLDGLLGSTSMLRLTTTMHSPGHVVDGQQERWLLDLGNAVGVRVSGDVTGSDARLFVWVHTADAWCLSATTVGTVTREWQCSTPVPGEGLASGLEALARLRAATSADPQGPDGWVGLGVDLHLAAQRCADLLGHPIGPTSDELRDVETVRVRLDGGRLVAVEEAGTRRRALRSRPWRRTVEIATYTGPPLQRRPEHPADVEAAHLAGLASSALVPT